MGNYKYYYSPSRQGKHHCHCDYHNMSVLVSDLTDVSPQTMVSGFKGRLECLPEALVLQRSQLKNRYYMH
jgi:hypothetical protein